MPPFPGAPGRDTPPSVARGSESRHHPATLGTVRADRRRETISPRDGSSDPAAAELDQLPVSSIPVGSTSQNLPPNAATPWPCAPPGWLKAKK